MSAWPVELFLALRYLRPKRTFVSVITIISVIGVTLGVAVLIIVISVMTGFDLQLREKILGFNAHLRVVRAGTAPIENVGPVSAAVRADPHVRAVAPFVLGKVLVETQPAEGNPLQGAPWIRGLDPRLETNMSTLTTNIVAGAFDVSGRGLLVGTEFARSMHLRVGDRLAIYSSKDLQELRQRQHQTNQNASVPVPDEYTVRGVFDVGYYEYNADVIIVSLENAQELHRLDDSVHGLLVMLDDPFRAVSVQESLERRLGPDFRVYSWTEDHSGILNALVVEKNVMFYLLFFIVIVAAFGIMNSQITFVVQKTREIGILKALGASQRQVMGLFLGQSLIVGTAGVLTGFGLGMLAVHFRNEFLHFMNRVTGLELFPASIYSFTELPAKIVPQDIAIICGSALVICLLAGMVPAWTAMRLRPVEALRHE